jgi:hypothetical protein
LKADRYITALGELKMKKLLIGLSLLALSAAANANFFDSNNGEWKMGPNGPYYEKNDWPEWTPMYWMDEMMDSFDDNNDNSSGFGNMPFMGNNNSNGFGNMPFMGNNNGNGFGNMPFMGNNNNNYPPMVYGAPMMAPQMMPPQMGAPMMAPQMMPPQMVPMPAAPVAGTTPGPAAN